MIFKLSPTAAQRLPFLETSIPCGDPAALYDSGLASLDLNELVSEGYNKPVIVVRAVGYSMTDYGISPGDIVCFHRTSTAKNGDIVLAFINGEPTIKKFEEVIHGTRRHLRLVGSEGYARELRKRDTILIEGVHAYTLSPARRI